MDIQTSTVKKIVINKVSNLDSIAVYLEDYSKGKGKVTITCFNDSWTYCWTAMGDNTLAEFISTCDNHYLSEKLNPTVDREICDNKAYEKFAKDHIIYRRRKDCIPKEEARELYDKCRYLGDYKYEDSAEFARIMYEIFGDDWYECEPKRLNPKYQYFCRILDTIKEALKTSENIN